MVEPEHGNITQHKRDREAYQTWKKKNNSARIGLLSSMQDDLMCEFEVYETSQEMWLILKQKFGGTLTTKLWKLKIKLDSYKKC